MQKTIPAPGDTTGDDDRTRLQQFIVFVRAFLNELIMDRVDPTDGTPLFYADFPVDLMVGAWEEALPTFEEVLDAIGEAPENKLAQHGLLGLQLDFKLGAVGFLRSRWGRIGRKVLGPLLSAIDTVLGSILEAVGVGKALEELKECVAVGIDAAPEG
jgi:hypothetical protein